MDRRYNDNDFERLLKENADQYRMYPSEKVWKGIHSALHTRRKWYRISALALLIMTGAGLSVFIFSDSSIKQSNVVIEKPITATKLQIQTPDNLTEKSFPVSKTIHSAISKEEKKSIAISDSDTPDVLTVNQKQETSILPDDINEQALITEISINEFQKLESNSEVIQKESDNPVIEINEEKLNEDARLKVDISALASQNVPIPISKKQQRYTAQLYFTPTVSYRKLSENSSKGNYSYAQLVGVNNLVKHKPLIGLEFGIEGKYSLSEKFFFKSGFQFNINRYDISAYYHPTEIASVTVNSGFRTYNLSAPSNYGNFSGNKQNWVENFYFQAALPVGVEFILIEKRKFNWGISGTIQPTYTIGDRAYLISSDFRNYAKFPDLMRRWNLSTGAETFISYSTGKIRWQTGPHIRYQHLSSFVTGYPVKENLFAVGLKIGATLNYKK